MVLKIECKFLQKYEFLGSVWCEFWVRVVCVLNVFGGVWVWVMCVYLYICQSTYMRVYVSLRVYYLKNEKIHLRCV